jgi:hypothetical protein
VAGDRVGGQIGARRILTLHLAFERQA